MFFINKKISAICDSYEKEARDMLITADLPQTSEFDRACLEHCAIVRYNLVRELRAANHPKFGLDFIFKIFRKNAKCPGSGRF